MSYIYLPDLVMNSMRWDITRWNLCNTYIDQQYIVTSVTLYVPLS